MKPSKGASANGATCNHVYPPITNNKEADQGLLRFSLKARGGTDYQAKGFSSTNRL